jgi:hypothetical protein
LNIGKLNGGWLEAEIILVIGLGIIAAVAVAGILLRVSKRSDYKKPTKYYGGTTPVGAGYPPDTVEEPYIPKKIDHYKDRPPPSAQLDGDLDSEPVLDAAEPTQDQITKVED